VEFEHFFRVESESFFAVLLGFAAAALTVHAVLSRKDSRTTIAWVGLIWLAPVVGGILYLMLGINRIRRRAIRARGDRPQLTHVPESKPVDLGDTSLVHLATLVGRLTRAPLVGGNQVEPLTTGTAAFDAMRQAFEQARSSISLSTYIFDNDPVGRDFVDVLARAKDRGVEVCVIVDAAGARYTMPTALSLLNARGVRAVAFLPSRIPARLLAVNLRNHRKIAVVDGEVAFTGGMNIREGHVLLDGPRAIQDLHFRLVGPIVTQLQQAFATDWFFCTRQVLQGPSWFPTLEAAGDAVARGIPDGPDEDFDKLRLTLLGALSCAERTVSIVTPYFIPDPTVATALEVTALRGVRVDVLVPERSNLPIVPWAMWSHFEPLVKKGVRILLTPPPFDHSKLMVVDDRWSLFGSANWDARSLVLHFEMNVECYDANLAAKLGQLIEAKRSRARTVTLRELADRSVFLKIRDGIADLASPYL
jgi:cardiolipin synthase A/B